MLSSVRKHTAIQTVLLHLLPGLIQLAVFILLIPFALRLGYPSSFADHIGTYVALVPIQVGILLFIAKKKTGTYRINKLMPYLEKSILSEYLLFILIMLVWAFGINAILSPMENSLRDGLFSFVPDSIAMRNTDVIVAGKHKLVISACLGILTNGIVAPVTEELYFRGYLLPRINASPIMAVILSAVLFSLYHFFSPWYFFSRVIMMIPLYYWVMKRKNIRFSIVAHVIANVIASTLGLVEVLRL